LVQVAVEQAALHAGGGLAVTAVRQTRYQYLHAAVLGAYLQPGLLLVGGHRLFQEQQVVVPRKARHQVLRALVDEAPAQMRQAQQGRALRVEDRLRGRQLRMAALANVVLIGTCPAHVHLFRLVVAKRRRHGRMPRRRQWTTPRRRGSTPSGGRHAVDERGTCPEALRPILQDVSLAGPEAVGGCLPPSGPSHHWIEQPSPARLALDNARSRRTKDQEAHHMILITGGAGYIGSHAALELLQAGHEVLVLDNLCNSSERALQRVEQLARRPLTFIQGDVRNAALLKSLFETYPVEAVMHFAGLKAVGESVREPLRYYDTNVGGSITLCQAMADAGVFRLVFSSSATVYGDVAQMPISEDCPTGSPSNPYGQSKLMAENVLRGLAESDSRWSIGLLRYFNPIG